MAQCTKTVGCVLTVPADETGPCTKCAGFKTIGKIVNGKPTGGVITCDMCSGNGFVTLVDNTTAQHAGPCRLPGACVCEASSSPMPGAWCNAHNRRAKTPADLVMAAQRVAAILANPPAPALTQEEIIAAEKKVRDDYFATASRLAAKVSKG